MNVTVCEVPINWAESDYQWHFMLDHLHDEKSDLILLPEMPFYKWLAGTRQVDPREWEAAVAAHDQWIQRFNELPTPIVVGSRPVIRAGQRLNEGYIWTKKSGYQAVHVKRYLPNEEGFWEATWYQCGDRDFQTVNIDGLKIGFLICTELWFNAHAREYAKQGIHLLVCPRVTPLASVDKWVAGGQTAAVVSGAFCLSSNLSGTQTGDMDFGGCGWIIEPEEGNILGITSAENPFLSLEIDLKDAEKAKTTYPRYVLD